MPETWDEYLQHPDFQSLSSEDKIYAAKGFYRRKVKDFPNTNEDDFIESVKPSIYGKSETFEPLTTGILKSGAGWAAPIVQGVTKSLYGQSPTLEEVTEGIVGKDRLYHSTHSGIGEKVLEGVGSALLDLPMYATIGKIMPSMALTEKATTTEKVIASLIHQAETFGVAGGYRGAAEDDTIEGVKKGALEGAAVAVPFTAASYPRNIFKRILGTGAAGGLIAGLSGGDEQDIISSTILMGALGAFSKTLQTKIDKGMVDETNLKKEVKKDTGRELEEIVNEATEKAKGQLPLPFGDKIRQQPKEPSPFELNKTEEDTQLDLLLEQPKPQVDKNQLVLNLINNSPKFKEPIFSGISPAEIAAMVFETEFQRVDRLKQSPIGAQLLKDNLKIEELNSILEDAKKEVMGLPKYKEPPIEGQLIEVDELPIVKDDIKTLDKKIKNAQDIVGGVEKPKEIKSPLEVHEEWGKKEVFVREPDERNKVNGKIVRDLIEMTPEQRQKSALGISEFQQLNKERIKEASEKFELKRKNEELEERQEEERALVERTKSRAEFNKRSLAGEDINSKEMQSLFNKSIEKVPTAGKPDNFAYRKEKGEGIRKVIEMSEAEEVAALAGREINESRKTQLNMGVDPIQVVEAIRKGVDVVKNLSSLGERVIREGAMTFKDFVYKMKDYLGELFKQFSNQMSHLYKIIKEDIIKLGKDERGLIGRDISESKVADKKIFEEMKKRDEIIKVNKIGKLFPEIVFVSHEGVKLKDDFFPKKEVTNFKKGKNKIEELITYKSKEMKDTPLLEILNAEKWYKLYPFLKDIKLNSSEFSYFDTRDGKVYIERNQSPSETLSDIKHEIQHILQYAEGLPSGSSPEAELISIIFHATTVLENTLSPNVLKAKEFKHDINFVHKLSDKMSRNQMRASKTMYDSVEKILNKYGNLKEILKEIYPEYQDESLSELTFRKYEGVISESMARLTGAVGNYITNKEVMVGDIRNKIIVEAGLYPSERAGSITPLSRKAEKILDDESSISQQKVYDIAKNIFEDFSNKGGNILNSISAGVRNALRIPSYHESISKITEIWHENIERRGTLITNKSRFYMRDFFDNLTPDEKMKLNSMWNYDAEKIEKTPEQLVKEGYTPNMIKAYQGIRRGFDYLHDRFLQTELSKLYMKTLTDTELSKQVEGYSTSTPEMKLHIKQAVANLKSEKIVKESNIPGYLPHYRFGRYVVHVTDGEGTVANRGFETQKMAQEYIDGKKYLSEEGIKDIKGSIRERLIDTKYEKVDAVEMMTIERYIPLIKRIMKEAGIEDADINETTGILHDKWLDVFASGKLAKREGIPGYDTDLERAIITYTENFPKSILKRFIQPDLKEAIKNIPTKEGQREYGENLVDFLYNRTDREGKVNKAVRSYMYLNYLVLKPAFAALNLTGRVTMTAPFTISEFARLRPESSFMDATKGGWKYFTDAQNKEFQLIKDMANGFMNKVPLLDIIQKAPYLNFEEKIVLSNLHRQGEFKAMRQVEIGGTEYEKWLGKIDFMGRLSERSNRIHAALVAVNLYKDLGYSGSLGDRTSIRVKGLVDVVDKFVGKTQVLYSKSNRPEIARGWKAPIMVFKGFMLNYLNLYYEMLGEKNKAAFVNGLATTMAIGGAAGVIPARDEIEKIVDYFMKNVVDDPSWAVKKQDYLDAMSKPAVAKALLYGLPSMIGIDASGMVGFPNVTGSAVLPMIEGAIELPKNIFRPDMTTTEKFKVFLPSQAKHLYNLYKITKYGVPTDRTGKPIIYPKDIEGVPYNSREAAFKMYDNLPKEMSVSDKFAMAFGFPTMAVNDYYADVQAIKDAKETSKVRIAQFHRAIAKAIIADDKEEVETLSNKAERMGLKLSNKAILGHISAYE